MPETGRDLTDTVFGAPQAAAAPVDQWRQTLRLDDLERQHSLPSGLMTSILRQESGGDPRVKSSAGAQGLFQFMPATAAQYKIDPLDPEQAAPAAAKELRTLYTKYHGDVDRTLAAWNWGQGNVDRKGMERMPTETRGFLAHVKRFIGPASAEAATPQGGRDLTGTFAQPQPGGGRDLSDMLFGATPPETPSGGTQEPATGSQTAPPPQTPPGSSQGPPGARLSLGDPTEAASEAEAAATIAAMRARQAPQAHAPTGALAMGGGTMQQAPPVTDPAALLAGGRQAPAPQPAPAPAAAPAPMTMRGQIGAINPLTPRGAEAVQGRVHESGMPASALPALAVNAALTGGGAFAGSFLGPVGSAAGAALGGSAATRINTKLGLTGQEKPLLETPYANVYPSDLLGALPLGIAGATSALKGVVRNLPGANVGRHELAAEKLAELGQRVGPAEPSRALFAEAAAKGGNVPTVNLWREAGKVVREEKGMEKGFVSTEAMQAGGGLLDLMRKHGGQVPLDEVEKYRQRLFQKIQTTTDRAELKRLQDLYGAIHEDLALAATAGTTAGAGTLKAAIAAKRKEHAQETLTDVWSPGKGLQLQEGEHVQVYGKRIRNEVEKKLHQDTLFAGSFTPAETVDIRNTLHEVGKLTRMTNPDAQGAVGSTLKWLGRLGGAGGAGYGIATGDLSTIITGGTMLLATEGATAVLTSAMQSKAGRWALREAIKEGNGTLTHGSLAAIASLVAREAAPDAPAPQQTP